MDAPFAVRDPIFSASEVVDLSRAVAVGYDIVQLDEFWVQEGRVAARPGQAERARALVTVGNELAGRLKEWERLVPRFGQIVGEHADEVLKVLKAKTTPVAPGEVEPGIDTSLTGRGGETVIPEPVAAVMEQIAGFTPQQLQETIAGTAEQVAAQIGIGIGVVEQAVEHLSTGIGDGGGDITSVVEKIAGKLLGSGGTGHDFAFSGHGGPGHGGGLFTFLGCLVGTLVGQPKLGCAIGQLVQEVVQPIEG